MDKIKEIWKVSGQLKPKAYLNLVPIIWWALIAWCIYEAFLVKWTFSDLISLLFIAFFVYVDTRFYPWIKDWVSHLALFRGLFEGDNGFLNIVKEAKDTYNGTGYDYNVYRDKNGQYFKQTNTRSKREGASWVIVYKFIIRPYMRFVVLCIAGMFGCVTGWFIVPKVLKRIKNG